MNYTEFLCNIKQSMTEVFDSSFNICVKPIEKIMVLIWTDLSSVIPIIISRQPYI